MLSPCRISKLYSVMIANKATDRVKRIEEISVPYMKESTKEKFLDSLFKEMGDEYREAKMVSEDELKRILERGGR